MIRTHIATFAVGAALLGGCQPQRPGPGSTSASTVTARTTTSASAAGTPAATSASATSTGPDDGIPRTVNDLPALIGANVESRAVNCQVFTTLQAQAITGAEAARFQAAADAWGLQLRAENNGDRAAAAQTFASFVAPYANHTVPPPPPVVIRAAADQCLASAPAMPR